MGRSYAITLSFEPERLRLHQVTEDGAQATVGDILTRHGFSAQMPGFYIGPSEANAIGAVLAAQDLADSLAWFAPCIRAARLLRIEEDSDLTAAFG